MPLEVLRSDMLPRSRRQFVIMAEGPLAQLRSLEQEISGYVESEIESSDEVELKIVTADIT